MTPKNAVATSSRQTVSSRTGTSNSNSAQSSKAKEASLSTNLNLAIDAISVAVQQKGLDIRGVDLSSISDVADFFVLVSGTSDRHVRSIADKIEAELKKDGETALSRSGNETSRWIILDYGNIVIHVFQQESRQFYNLDELWKNANAIELPVELDKEVKRSRTGLMG